MKKDVRRRYDIYIERELSKIKSDFNRQLSVCFEQSKKELADLRSELTDKVFGNVLKEIESFAKTEDYFNLLLNSIRALKEQLGGGEIKYFLCERDTVLKEKLEKAIGEKLDISADNDITVGGVKALDTATSTIADDTLDIRLAAEKEWFLENSGLKV